VRRRSGVRCPKSSKPETCTERYDVDPTGISVKVSASYPGRSAHVQCATDIERCRDACAEVIHGRPRLPSLQSMTEMRLRLRPYIRTLNEAEPRSLMEYAGRHLDQQNALDGALTSTGFAVPGLTCFCHHVMIACAIGGSSPLKGCRRFTLCRRVFHGAAACRFNTARGERRGGETRVHGATR